MNKFKIKNQKSVIICVVIVILTTVLAGCIGKENGGEKPIIVYTNIRDGDVNVPLDIPIIVKFSKSMLTESVKYRCVPDPGGWSISWKDDNTNATFKHTPFEKNVSYTFEIKEAKDKSGNELGSGRLPKLFAFSTGSEKPGGSIKVGGLLPLTGQIASIAKNIMNGMELAAIEINKEGGIKGKRLVLIYGDTRLDATEGVKELTRLVDVEGVKAVIGAVSSTITLPCIDKVVIKKKIIMISPASTYVGITIPRRSEYFFRNIPNDRVQGPRAAETVYNILNLKKVCILYENNDYGIGLRDEFVKKFKSLGGEILGEPQSFDVGATDFSIQVLNAVSKNPELIYVPGHYREIAMIVKEANAQNFKGKILASEAFECVEVFDVGGKMIDGTLFMKPTSELERPQFKRFVTNYTTEYGESPAAFSDFAYDCVKIIAEAIKNVGYEPDRMKDYISKTVFKNTATRDIEFDSNGDVKNADYSLYITDYEKRTFKPYKPYFFLNNDEKRSSPFFSTSISTSTSFSPLFIAVDPTLSRIPIFIRFSVKVTSSMSG